MSSDLLQRKSTAFVLWRPGHTNPPPQLVIGRSKPGNPSDFVDQQRFDLRPAAVSTDLWELPATECNLVHGQVYHYWFEVSDTNPYRDHGATPARILCTDPTAWTVDWRLRAPRPAGPYSEDDRDPAAVVKFAGGRLIPCDPGGETTDFGGDADPATLPPNNRLVIYELPTTWTRLSDLEAGVQLAVGTFRDAMARIETPPPPPSFAGIEVLEQGLEHLKNLGINALELLPPADSFVDREWGYATSNYFAPDYDLGFPRYHASPTAAQDLAALVRLCHAHGMRFFVDVVMAFATHYAYENVNYLDFHVQTNAGDPEEDHRDAFGGDLFKYNYFSNGYDPISGQVRNLVPARQLMLTYLTRWMQDFRVDGLRLDSVVNIANYDFVQAFKDRGRELWRQRAAAAGLTGAAAEERFLVVGEELAVPFALLAQQRLDGLWNEKFKYRVRAALLGEGSEGDNFEWTVRRMIDCRLLSDRDGAFTDGAQAINYITSHDVEGYRNERLYEFLRNNAMFETEQRIKLAFVCLLTAVGIPMIFAGEEFADEHDLPVSHPQKQVDPVNYDRLNGDANAFRRRILAYVTRLVQYRTRYDALAVNDTDFLHVDFNDGKRVLVWRRGTPGSDRQVVVVANFSDWGTSDPFNPASEYVVPGFPATPHGQQWREITQDRPVPAEWVGREPIFPWEAKVYALA